MALVNKSKLRETIKELDKENSISSVAEDVGIALERKVEKILEDAINRAKANKRRTIQPRDL
jgi:histone H3/H4